MFRKHCATSLWSTRCIPWMYVWLNYVFVLFFINNRQISKMATFTNLQQLIKSTRILNLFLKLNWRDGFTTHKTHQVSICSVFSVINISLRANLFLNQANLAKYYSKLTCVTFHNLSMSMWNTFQIVIYVLICTQLAQGAFWDT